MIIHGDCIEALSKLDENSIDTVITDPPYGIGFMGKEWDTFNPEYQQGEVREKIKKRGRIMRADGCARESGFDHTSSLAGTYDQSLKGHIGFQEWFTPIFQELLRVSKPGATLMVFGGTRTYHRMACAVEDAGWVIKDCIMWLYGSGFPKATDISKQLDKGHKRKVVGKGKSGKTAIWQEQGGMGNFNITEPATEEAKLWNGWKSHGLKPAYEPILVAMKPNDGSYANNALKHGVSGLNIDGGRIQSNGEHKRPEQHSNYDRGVYGKQSKFVPTNADGRFPANVILDEEAGAMLDEQSGESKSNKRPSTEQHKSGDIYGKYTDYGYERGHTDKGGASRFFYCAKASKAERNMGCEELEAGEVKRQGLCGEHKNPKHQNSHPTVKPLKLMEYLCTLTKTPTGGVVLDPFMGSGTTGMACKLTGRDFIGIEKEEEYVKIAEKRIEGLKVQEQLDL